jgi:hypothetical protein
LAGRPRQRPLPDHLPASLHPPVSDRPAPATPDRVAPPGEPHLITGGARWKNGGAHSLSRRRHRTARRRTRSRGRRASVPGSGSRRATRRGVNHPGSRRRYVQLRRPGAFGVGRRASRARQRSLRAERGSRAPLRAAGAAHHIDDIGAPAGTLGDPLAPGLTAALRGPRRHSHRRLGPEGSLPGGPGGPNHRHTATPGRRIRLRSLRHPATELRLRELVPVSQTIQPASWRPGRHLAALSSPPVQQRDRRLRGRRDLAMRPPGHHATRHRIGRHALSPQCLTAPPASARSLPGRTVDQVHRPAGRVCRRSEPIDE